MKKEKIISKFNIKNYSNELEKILTKKNYSSDTKNLLSDMLYKIENSYEDYKNVKIDVKPKGEILQEIIDIIKNQCKEIEITREKISNSDRNIGKIVTYLNAKKMLYEIYQMENEQFQINEKHYISKKSLEHTLNQGYSINGSEIIRDFDGWSWNIQENEIEDRINNFLYQSLIILVGDTFLSEWKSNPSEDYLVKLLEELEKKYKTERADKIVKLIKQIAILDYTEKDNEEKIRLIDIEKKLVQEYKEITDKKTYIKNITDDKREINKKICSIDAIVNDDRELKKQFIIRNEQLDSNERIFSLSDFVDILQHEKSVLMDELNECNKKLEPLNFIKAKLDIESKLITIKELNLNENTDKIFLTKIKELIALVCDAMRMQLEMSTEKEKIIEILYKIRYFKTIPIDRQKNISDLIDFDKLENYAITVACKMKVLNIISKNIKENYEIIKNIFKTDIIQMDKIQVKFIEKDKKIFLEIYEEENKNTTIEFEKIEELNVVKNKKIKLFI